MRKFLAFVMLFIILIGTLSPVSLLLGRGESGTRFGIQKRIVNAAESEFTNNQGETTISQTEGKEQGIFTFSTRFKTDASSLRSRAAGKAFLFDTSTGKIEKFSGSCKAEQGVCIESTKINYTNFTADKWNDYTFTLQNKLEDGTYQMWLVSPYEENITSSRLRFTVSNGNISNVEQYQNASNTDSKYSIAFISDMKVDITEGNNNTLVTGNILYRDPNDPSKKDDSITETIKLQLQLYAIGTTPTVDGVGTVYSETQTIKLKLGTQELYSFSLKELELDKQYKVRIVSDVKTDTGNSIVSQLLSFTAGKSNSQERIPQEQDTNNSTDEQYGMDCKMLEFRCALVDFTVTMLTFVPNGVATIIGLLADFFLSLAISPSTYGANYNSGIGETIYVAWKMIRDFANIGFIFALFVSAFMLILNKTDISGTQFNPKKTVVRVVIMALLVNFSLFFCRMIIQTADVFSHILYNQITVDTTANTGPISRWISSSGLKSPSFAFVNKVNPQSVFTDAGLVKEMKGSYTSYLFIGVIAFIIYLVLIYIFVSMLFIWLARIVGLWLSMILSPLAFVSYAIPFIESDKHIGFVNWIKNFTSLAFLTPVYLFFLYIALTILNLSSLNSGITLASADGSEGGFMVTIVSVLLKTMIPLFGGAAILMRGKKVAEDMAGELGNLAGNISGKVAPMLLGAATGGTALLARQTFGRVGNVIGNSETLEKLEGKNMFGISTGARMLGRAGRSMGATTFDPRNSKQLQQGFGKITGAMGEKVDLGNKFQQNEGGYAKEGGIRDNIGKGIDKISGWNEDRKKENADDLANRMKKRADEKEAKIKEKIEREKEARRNEETFINSEANNLTMKERMEEEVAEKQENLMTTNLDISRIDDEIKENNKDLTQASAGFNQIQYDANIAARDTAQQQFNIADQKMKELIELARVGKEYADKEKTPEAQAAYDQAKKEMTDFQVKLADAQDNMNRATQGAASQIAAKEAVEKAQARGADLAAKRDLLINQRTIDQEQLAKANTGGDYAEYLKNPDGSDMTYIQAEGRIKEDQVKAEQSPEGREYSAARNKRKEKEQERKENQAKLKKAQKEGDTVGTAELIEKIKKQDDEVENLKNEETAKKDAFLRASGGVDHEKLLKGLKNSRKTYAEKQSERLKKFDDNIANFTVELAGQVRETNEYIQNVMNDMLKSHQNSSEFWGKQNEKFANKTQGIRENYNLFARGNTRNKTVNRVVNVLGGERTFGQISDKMNPNRSSGNTATHIQNNSMRR